MKCNKREILTMLLLLTASVSLTAQTVSVRKGGGETSYYDTFLEAVEAANASNGAVLTLLDDACVETDDVILTSSTTIDLNGYMLWGISGKMLTAQGRNANVTITDSSSDQTGVIYQEIDAGDKAYCLNATNYATLTLNAGTVVCTKLMTYKEPATTVGVYLSDHATFLMNGGAIDVNNNYNGSYGVYLTGTSSATISQGKITTKASHYYAYAIYQPNGSLTITDGTFLSDALYGSYCLYNGAKATTTVNGGRFVSSSQGGVITDVSLASSTALTKINGGAWAHEYGLEKFIGNRYLKPIERSSEDYLMGCRVMLSDQKITDIAQNLTTRKGYTTLEQAISEAAMGDTISLTNDYTLSHDLTIPSGVMLLIPYDVVNTCPTTLPEASQMIHKEESIYRTLTVSNGVKITVLGGMSVAAMQLSENGGRTDGAGACNGNHALVMLGKDSEIDVHGNLYCWGYVSGEGRVTIRSGATLYESLVIADHRGGTISSDVEEKLYPYTQQYVQNVETPVTFHYGARNMLATHISYEAHSYSVAEIPYITPDTAGLYRMHNGSLITRQYLPHTDRMEYLFEGNGTLGTLVVSYQGIKINSMYYIFPLNSNLTISINGGELKIPYDYYLQPGTQINIAHDAVVSIEPNSHLYLYDRQDWQDIYCMKGYVLPLEYTIANGHDNRAVRWSSTTVGDDAASYAKLPTGKIVVDGSLLIKGQMMTSKSGATNVAGSGTVIFHNNGKRETSQLYQAKRVTSELSEISFASLPLSAGYLAGDADKDGRITMSDANTVVNSYFKTITPNLYLYDLDGDGTITMSDANAIVNMYLEGEE